MLALCGGSRDAAAAGLIRRMQATRRVGNEAEAVIAHPGLHVATGHLAFSLGEYSNARAHLRGDRGDLQSIGGSHAQRDVFDRITIEAALRGGHVDAAKGLLRDRMTHRAGVAENYAQARLTQIGALRQQAT